MTRIRINLQGEESRTSSSAISFPTKLEVARSTSTSPGQMLLNLSKAFLASSAALSTFTAVGSAIGFLLTSLCGAFHPDWTTDDKACKDVFTTRMAATLSCSGVEDDVSVRPTLVFRLALLSAPERVVCFVALIVLRVVLRVVVAITARVDERYQVYGEERLRRVRDPVTIYNHDHVIRTGRNLRGYVSNLIMKTRTRIQCKLVTLVV